MKSGKDITQKVPQQFEFDGKEIVQVILSSSEEEVQEKAIAEKINESTS